jgi:metallophosphoesterase (TIGR03767 family)
MPPFIVRADLGGTPSSAIAGGVDKTGAVEALVALVHLTDLHVLDAASPARAEWVELEGADPLWRPLLHMHRPYDALTTFALHAHVEAIRRDPVGRTTGRGLDIAISSGDNIDNAQRNELDAYLALISGGTAQLSAVGSAQDASVRDSATIWPYWSPDASVPDAWRDAGYPVVDDFVARVSAPITSAGLGLPWTSVPGNHDLMRQGTALPDPALERVATGAAKSLRHPIGFRPDDPLGHFLDAPADFSAGPSFAIAADPDRRAIDRREWLSAHIEAGALGYSARHVDASSIDTVIDTEHVRFVLLDTNHPAGDYQGSIGVDQLAWLHDRLSEVRAGRYAVLVSHHGAGSLVNDLGHDPARRHGDALLDVAHRHRCLIAWLVGHRHLNRIEARPGASGGFWEITTASIIDWPSQARSIELVRRDENLELVCTLLDHDDTPDGLGTLHRDLARRFASTGVSTRMSGRDIDGNVRLLLPDR